MNNDTPTWPADMRLDELEFPFEGVSYALPESFSVPYFGLDIRVPFINNRRLMPVNQELPDYLQPKCRTKRTSLVPG